MKGHSHPSKLSTVKERPVILLDETKVKQDGKEHMVCVSACLDLSRREVVSIQAFRSPSSISTISVANQALKLCESKPIMMVDHEPWYYWTFDGFFNKDIPWIQITHGLRNYIERWYRTFKERTRRFHNNFPIRELDGALEKISSFLHLFAYWYNHMRPQERFHNATPFSLS